MGTTRIIARHAAGLALLVAGAGGLAAPREPLIVSELSDPDVALVTAAGAKAEGAVADGPVLDFSRAINQQLAVQQQQIAAQCKSSQAASASAGKQWAWAAACRYQRR